MKAETAKHLIRFYCVQVVPDTALRDDVRFSELSERMDALENPSDGKIMRWLGFMQGGLVAVGARSLESVKEDSMVAVADE